MDNQQNKKRLKPAKLEWQGGILENGTEHAVVLKGEAPAGLVAEKAPPKTLKGSVCLRVEKKGRAGNPVIILFKFSDPEARNLNSLKELCSSLKEKLGCGGTVDNGEIILILRDTEKLKSVLINKFQLKVK